jgi:hypothetical protein
MREEPIFSGGVVKAALVILVGAALGFGAYALVAGVDVNLPDLPEIDTTSDTSGQATTLSDTTLEDTTLGERTATEEPVAQTSSDPFTRAGLDSALGQVSREVGAGAQLTRLTINDVQTQFIVRRGNGIEAQSVRADTGELTREDASVTISGDATIADFAYGLSEVDPGAVDRMLAAARKQSGAPDFTPTVLSLERAIPSSSKRLEWTINAEAGGRYLTYRAAADGSAVRDLGG